MFFQQSDAINVNKTMLVYMHTYYNLYSEHVRVTQNFFCKQECLFCYIMFVIFNLFNSNHLQLRANSNAASYL